MDRHDDDAQGQRGALMTRRYTHLIANGYEHPIHPPIAAHMSRWARTDALSDAVYDAIYAGRLTAEEGLAVIFAGIDSDEVIGVERAACEAAETGKDE